MKNFGTQDERVLNHLLAEGSIEPLTAWKTLGVYRLSAVIHRLRDAGHDIVSDRVPVQNQFGETCRVANYILV